MVWLGNTLTSCRLHQVCVLRSNGQFRNQQPRVGRLSADPHQNTVRGNRRERLVISRLAEDSCGAAVAGPPLASVFPRLAEPARRLWLLSLRLGPFWNDVLCLRITCPCQPPRQEAVNRRALSNLELVNHRLSTAARVSTSLRLTENGSLQTAPSPASRVLGASHRGGAK